MKTIIVWDFFFSKIPEADEGFFEDIEDSEIDVRGVGVNPEFED